MTVPNHFRIPDEGYIDDDLVGDPCPCGALFDEDCICDELLDDTYPEWSGSMPTDYDGVDVYDLL